MFVLTSLLPKEWIQISINLRSIGILASPVGLDGMITDVSVFESSEREVLFQYIKQVLRKSILAINNNQEFFKSRDIDDDFEKALCDIADLVVTGDDVETPDADDVLYDSLRKTAEQRFTTFYKPCGLNADWSTQAWYIGTGTPNEMLDDYYIVDNEDGSYSICKRVLDDDQEDKAVELIRIDLHLANDMELGLEMIDLLNHTAVYINQNL